MDDESLIQHVKNIPINDEYLNYTFKGGRLSDGM